MAIAVKAAADVANKYASVTPGRSAFYELGVKNPRTSWSGATVAAAPNFKQAVSAADIEKRFAGGARKAGDAKWGRKSAEIGVGRFGPGVTAAKADYEQAVGPYLQAIGSLNLPARQPRGSSANLERVAVIATALSKLRLATKAGGA